MYHKIFTSIRAVFSQMWAELRRNVLSRNVEESFKKYWIWIWRSDDFQHLTSSSLTTDTSVVKFSWGSVQWFHVKLLTDRETNKETSKQTDRQTDRQINKRRALHNLLGGDNNNEHSEAQTSAKAAGPKCTMTSKNLVSINQSIVV